MARQPKTKTKKDQNEATVGFEQKLWKATDALCKTLLPKHISGELRVKDLEGTIRHQTT
ncbi:hypothetical protein [uncultured Nitrospira sp.]|uniref:hypothetical protein n=1 Tax=uncultured Nitrospira sp. TaxID=157176 RepID=UPI0031400E54